MSESRSVLELKQITQAYGQQLVVKELSLTLERGEIGCLLGASGCGKTTVLRTIAGFEPLLEGEILVDGKCVSKQGYLLPPAKRQIGMVFQDYALFPHLSVFDNVVQDVVSQFDVPRFAYRLGKCFVARLDLHPQRTAVGVTGDVREVAKGNKSVVFLFAADVFHGSA